MSTVHVQNRTREPVTLLSAAGDTVDVPPGISPIRDKFAVNLPPYVKKVKVHKRRRPKDYAFRATEGSKAAESAQPTPPRTTQAQSSREGTDSGDGRRKRARQAESAETKADG